MQKPVNQYLKTVIKVNTDKKILICFKINPSFVNNQPVV